LTKLSGQSRAQSKRTKQQATSDLALWQSRVFISHASAKPQATSGKLDKLQAMGYYRI